MRTQSRPFIILPPRDGDLDELRANHVRLVPHACEACGELTTSGLFCADCADRMQPHEHEDPYDILGGEHGAE